MRIFLLLLLLICNSNAVTYFVGVDGLPSNSGTQSSPISMSKAMTIGVAGDTIQVLDGQYITPFGGYTFTSSGTSGAPITFKALNPTKVIINGTFKVSASYTIVRDLVFTAPDIFPSNTMSRYGAGSYTEALLGKTMPYGTYTWQSGTGNKIINNFFINSPGQCEDGSSSMNSEWYGNVFLNMGCQLADNETGESLYLQNGQAGSSKHFIDNISLNAALCNLDAWSQTSSAVNNVSVIGNFMGGGGQGKFQQAPEINYVGLQGNSNSLFFGNIFCRNPNSTVPNVATAYFGRPGYPNVQETMVIGNYFIGNGIQMANFDSSSSFLNNTFIDGMSGKLLNNLGKIDFNKYYNCFLNQEIDNVGQGTKTTWFANWNSKGYDLRGSAFGAWNSSPLVFVRPNRYQAGRANVAVINPNLSKSVNLDLSGCGFVDGDIIKVHNAFNMFKEAETFTYRSGFTYQLRMDNKGVMKRTNALPGYDVINPYPYYGVFLVMKK